MIFIFSVAKFTSGWYYARVEIPHSVHFESNRSPEPAPTAALFPVSYASFYYYACPAMLEVRSSGD